jgi:hypothetical protein
MALEEQRAQELRPEVAVRQGTDGGGRKRARPLGGAAAASAVAAAAAATAVAPFCDAVCTPSCDTATVAFELRQGGRGAAAGLALPFVRASPNITAALLAQHVACAVGCAATTVQPLLPESYEVAGSDTPLTDLLASLPAAPLPAVTYSLKLEQA